MLKRFSVMALVIALFSTVLVLESAQAQTGKNTELAARARARVTRFGVGHASKVEVKLQDKTRIKGYISDSDSDSFTVIENDTGDRRTLAYQDVVDVKKRGGGLSSKSWITIGAAAAGTIVTWIIVKPALCDGGAQSRGIC